MLHHRAGGCRADQASAVVSSVSARHIEPVIRLALGKRGSVRLQRKPEAIREERYRMVEAHERYQLQDLVDTERGPKGGS
jgi:hypothetical protein